MQFFWPSVWSKDKGGGGAWMRHCIGFCKGKALQYEIYQLFFSYEITILFNCITMIIIYIRWCCIQRKRKMVIAD